MSKAKSACAFLAPPANLSGSSNDPSSGGGGGKSKNRKQRPKLTKFNEGGTLEERLRRCEQWLQTLGLIVVSHERELNMIKRENNKVLVVETEIPLMERLDNSKSLWDTKRVIGARNPDGAYKDIAAAIFVDQVRADVAAAMDLDDMQRQQMEEAITIFEEGMPALQRFYVIRIQRPGDASKQTDEKKPVALIVVKFDMNQTPGAKAMNALWNMHEEGVMHHLFSMHMREDHAPMGSLCKAVQAALAKS